MQCLEACLCSAFSLGCLLRTLETYLPSSSVNYIQLFGKLLFFVCIFLVFISLALSSFYFPFILTLSVYMCIFYPLNYIYFCKTSQTVTGMWWTVNSPGVILVIPWFLLSPTD